MSVEDASVVNLLKNAKFAHLSTSNPETHQPNVTLMNYAYLSKNELYEDDKAIANAPATNQGEGEKVTSSFILFSVNKSATNYENIIKNPKVSILIHDWVTAKDTLNRENNEGSTSGVDISPLYQMLKSLNQNELSTISVTLNGEAVLVKSEDAGKYYKERLLKSYPDSKVFIEGENYVIILIKVQNCKIVDTHNNTKKY